MFCCFLYGSVGVIIEFFYIFSPGPAKPNPYTPCGRATPQTALRPFGGWPARRAGGLRPSSSPLDTPSRTGLHLDIRTRFVQGEFHVIMIHLLGSQPSAGLSTARGLVTLGVFDVFIYY
jgi:hypothetical protein